MSKNKDNNNDLKFAEEFAKLYCMSIEMTRKELEFAYARKDMWIKMRNNHYEMRPFKIFKNDYKKWEDRLKKIDDTINIINDSIEMLLKDYNDLLFSKN